MQYEPVFEFAYVPIMSGRHPLASHDVISDGSRGLPDILYGDSSIPALPSTRHANWRRPLKRKRPSPSMNAQASWNSSAGSKRHTRSLSGSAGCAERFGLTRNASISRQCLSRRDHLPRGLSLTRSDRLLIEKLRESQNASYRNKTSVHRPADAGFFMRIFLWHAHCLPSLHLIDNIISILIY